MAEEPVSTPQMTAKGSDYCATPESWEMRPEAQTPAQQLPSLTTTDQEMTTPHMQNYGISDSFNGFMDMYETPPGAHLYRDQCAYDSFDMSYQDMDNPSKAESSPPNDVPCDRITSERNPMPGDSPLEANKKGGCATKKESSLLHDEVKVYDDVQNNPHYIEDSIDRYNKFGVIDLQRSFNINETGSQQHVQDEVEECILERLDQQKYPQEDQPVQGQSASQIVPALCHLHVPPEHECLPSPKVEAVQDVSSMDQNVEDTSQAIPDNATAEEVCCTSEEKTEHFADYLNTSAAYSAGKESETKDERGQYPEETEVQSQTSSSTPLPPENMNNSSLMSMGAPHDAHELNQLADFLSMGDPFNCTSPSKEIDDEEPGSIPIADEKTASLPTPSKRKQRGRKVCAVSERRRSVRIARRESLLFTPCDAHLHTEISNDITNIVSVYDQNKSEAPPAVTAGLGQDHMDQAKIDYESEYVPHPFPEVGESSPPKSTLHCNKIKTMELGQMENPNTLMAPNDAEAFEHLNIDLPMSRKKRKNNNGRRRSVRLLEQDIQLDEGKPAFVSKPAVEEKMKMCYSSFLADFADFGLGDNWMPGDMFGEGQFAKTPKEKSGRRKSSRLSGVHIQLLELTDKSEVKVFGEEEEASFSNRRNVADLIKDLHTSDTASIVSSETTSMINVPKDVQGSGYERMESLTEFPFERQDAVQSSRKKRRRSIRLVKKPNEEPKCNLDSQQENQKGVPSKKAVKGNKIRNPVLRLQQENVLQEVKVTSLDNVSTEPQVEGKSFTILKAHVHLGDPLLKLDDDYEFGDSAEVMDFQESMVKTITRISKDTPLMGRKRVSRISEKDKEDDEAQDHQRDNTNVDRKQKKMTPTKANGDAKQEVSAQQQQQQQAKDVGAEELVNDHFQITNKIKLIYLRKGAALKKHNLETIFESPKKRATGTPVNLLGRKKMKRVVAFTDTPWLGRTGRTKGRKVKKGKQVKRILSSTVEKSWKLDIRLSSLDDPSP